MTPVPRAMRLWTGAPDAVWPAPPFGLREWSADAGAVAVLFEGSAATLRDASLLVPQVPAARTLAPSTPVILLGNSARNAARWRRLAGPRPVKIARAPRCATLLALGYVDIGAGVVGPTKADLVWGYSPHFTAS